MEIDRMMGRLAIRRPPPIRVFAIDETGVIKVIDSKMNGIPEIVHAWGDANSNPAVAVSLSCTDDSPLLAIARRNDMLQVQQINVIDPRDGSAVFGIDTDFNDPIVGLHLFDNKTMEANSPRSCKLVTFTENGQMEVSSYTLNGQHVEGSNVKWSAPKMTTLFSKFHETKNRSIIGGENGVLHLNDHESGQISWTAEPLDFLPSDTSFVAGSFIDEGMQWVAASDTDSVSIFDFRSRKPIQTFDLFLEKPGTVESSAIRSIVMDSAKSKVLHIGTNSGDLFSLDLNTGLRLDFHQTVGCSSLRHTSLYSDYPRVAPSGPVRAMDMHSAYSVIASAGNCCLDIWNTDDKRLMAKVDLDKNITHILFDYTSPKKADPLQKKHAADHQSQKPSKKRILNSKLYKELGCEKLRLG